MILRIGLDGASLDAPHDFTALSAVVDDGVDVAAWASIVDEGHLAVEPALLARLATPAGEDPDWSVGFERMLEYADRKGWVDADGLVRVHVES